MLFSRTPRVRLISAPTPLEKLQRLGAAWGHPNIYIKRDDLIPLGLGGNKVRSSEFWFGEAQALGADLILVAGLPASNQCRLAAAVSARLGLECHILHNAVGPNDFQGNQLLNHMMGVTQVFLGAVDEFIRADMVQEYAQKQAAQGRKPYIIGDPVVGALGYVNAALELHAQAEIAAFDLNHLFLAGSMGPTEAGLLWGSALLGNSFTVHTPSVEYPAPHLSSLIEGICEGISHKLGFTPAVAPISRLIASDSSLGAGYDKVTDEALAAVRDLAAYEGLFAETTYNAKVLASLKSSLARGEIDTDQGICIILTGGTPALFAQGSRFK